MCTCICVCERSRVDVCTCVCGREVKNRLDRKVLDALSICVDCCLCVCICVSYGQLKLGECFNHRFCFSFFTSLAPPQRQCVSHPDDNTPFTKAEKRYQTASLFSEAEGFFFSQKAFFISPYPLFQIGRAHV